MSHGYIMQKLGMSRIFTDLGQSIPVTVLEMLPLYVSQVKNLEKDGYFAIQVAAGKALPDRKVNKPQAGHFKKAGIEARRYLKEFRLSEEQLAAFALGQELNFEALKIGYKVKIRALTRGKGYAGTVKRWNFRTQDNSHGNS